jgi:hypothetical protein
VAERRKSMSMFGKALTRQEWNAAYFLGLEEVVTGRFQGGLDAQVRRGIEILAGTGYAFEVQTFLEKGGQLEAWSELPDEHGYACRELARGEFDLQGRAREAARWLEEAAPGIDGTWERRVLEARSYPTFPPQGGADRGFALSQSDGRPARATMQEAVGYPLSAGTA